MKFELLKAAELTLERRAHPAATAGMNLELADQAFMDALATQVEAHFVSRFGDLVALLHSGLSAGERYDEWSRIHSGEARVVIGARSAVFAPVPDLGLVVVDEAYPRCNMATDISALVAQEAFDALKGPVKMISPPHTPPV